MRPKSSSKTSNTFAFLGKILLLFLLSLVFRLPLPAHASGKTLVLFPLVIYGDQTRAYLHQGVKRMLVSRLAGEGLEVISDERLDSVLDEKEKKGITSKKKAEELARNLKADYAIFGSITTIGAGYSADLSLLELTREGSKLTPVSKTLDESRFIPGMAELAHELRAVIEGREIPRKKIAEPKGILPEPEIYGGLFSRTGQERLALPGQTSMEKGLFYRPREYQSFRPTGKIPFRFGVMALDTADLDGDGRAELVVVGREKMLVYQKQEGTFALRDTLESSTGENFLKVSIGDVDKNGRAEIYLVSRYGIRARTTVWEWAGKFKKVSHRAGHLQVVNDPVIGKSLLLFQDSKPDEFFSGRIYEMNYDAKEKINKGERLPKLRGIRFYSLALFDLNKDGSPEWIGLGDGNTLRVWDSQGAILWNSDKRLGGTNNAIRLGEPEAPGAPPPRISFDSRIVICDIDSDGKKEILVVKNTPLVKHVRDFKVYTESNLIAYRAEGSSLSPAWSTRDISYCITDMQAEGGTIFLAAQKGKIENVSKGSGYIMWFE